MDGLEPKTLRDINEVFLLFLFQTYAEEDEMHDYVGWNTLSILAK